jgi:hypothetical protein
MCGKAAQNGGKSLPFSWPVHGYSVSPSKIGEEDSHGFIFRLC